MENVVLPVCVKGVRPHEFRTVVTSSELVALEVFFSYAHTDEDLLNKLLVHLSGMRREGLITPWHDRRIEAGETWSEHIDTHLDTADIILLLISADFIASDYCYSVEMTRALECNARKEARVVPVILRPCDWSKQPFASLQALPTKAKPVTIWACSIRTWSNTSKLSLFTCMT